MLRAVKFSLRSAMPGSCKESFLVWHMKISDSSKKSPSSGDRLFSFISALA